MTARQQAIFTLDELATYLKVGKRTLYRLAAHGEIPAFKVGGTWRFRQSEIDQWINDQIQAGRKRVFRFAWTDFAGLAGAQAET